MREPALPNLGNDGRRASMPRAVNLNWREVRAARRTGQVRLRCQQQRAEAVEARHQCRVVGLQQAVADIDLGQAPSWDIGRADAVEQPAA